MMDVSFIIPSYNEEQIIEDTLGKVAAYIEESEWLGKTEVIVVAAGTDRTAELARAMHSKFARLEVVTPASYGGKGRDVRVGFQHATGEVQLFFDADLSTPLHHIKRMVALLRDGIDMVVGERKVSKIHPSLLRKMLSQAGPLASRIILGLPFHDTQCGFKGFRADAAKKLFSELETMGWGFDLELFMRAKEHRLAIRSIPINDWHEARPEAFRGQSVARAALRTLGELISIRMASWGRWCARHASGLFLVSSVAAGALAAYRNLRESIWFDEAFTAGLIQQPVHQLIQSTAGDVHPPLYYLVLKLWAAAFGHSIVTLRLFSVLCGMASVYLGLRLVRRLFGARPALWAMPFVVFAPFLLRYDIEARMYALAGLIGVVGTYVLVVALERRAAGQRALWLWVTYALLVAMGEYTLYYTALVWIAHALWCITLFFQHRPKHKLRALFKQPWLLAIAGALVLYAPWVPTFLHQAHNIQNGFWISKATLNTVVSLFGMMFTYQPNWQLSPWESLAFMIAAVAAVYFVVQAWRSITDRQRPYLALLLWSTLIPVAVLFLASLPPLQPVFVERYVTQTIISGYLLLGVTAAVVCKARPSAWRLLAAGFMLFVLIQGTFTLQNTGNYNFQNLSKPSAKEVMTYLYGQHASQGTVVSQDFGVYLELHYYASPDAQWLQPNVTHVVRLALGNRAFSSSYTPTTHLVWYVYHTQTPVGNRTPSAAHYRPIAFFSVPQGYRVTTYERFK